MPRITDYSALITPQADDLLPVVDVHDTTMAPTGSTKKITIWALLGLIPTATKTAAYTARPADLVICDTTAGPFTVTLPTAPADGTRVALKLTGFTVPNALTAACGGTDTFDHTPGSVTLTLTRLDQGQMLQYSAAGGTWYLVADNLDIPDTSALYSSSQPLPVVPQPTQVVTDFQSGHGWTGLAAGGSTYNLNDTGAGNFSVGTQCASGTTDGGGVNYASIRRLGAYTLNGTNCNVRVRFMVPNVTHVAQINLFLGNSSLAANYKWIIHRPGATYLTSGDWITCTLSWADATVTGSPTRSALTDAQLQILDDAGGTVTAHWQTLELIPDGRTTFPKGLVSITFDDSFATPNTLGAWQTMDANGWPGSLFLIADALGTAGCLTLPDVKTRSDVFGWEIAGHAYTGVDHNLSDTGLTSQQLDSDARQQRAWLSANGLRSADGYAYPLGNFGSTTDSQNVIGILRRYYTWSRMAGATAHETWPPADKWRLRSISNITSFAGGVTAATVNTLIDNTALYGGWQILVFHKIVSGAPASLLECSIADFNTIMTHLAASGVPVLTVGDALRHYSGEVKALDPAPATVQALSNSSTITTGGATLCPVTETGNVTGIILAPPPGPQTTVTVINRSAFTITFAASGTSNVADGVADIIPAQAARLFTWDAAGGLWYRDG